MLPSRRPMVQVSFFVGISSICECTAGKEVTHFMLIMAMVASRHG
jgi:hypothetical protein